MPKTTYQTLAEEAKGVFVGEFDRKGFKCGLGCYFWDDSSVYEGNWFLGEKHGLGVYVWPDGTTYAGEWKDGHKHGFGVASNPDGRLLEGDWAGGKFVSKAPAKAQQMAQAAYVEQAKARGLARRRGFNGALEGTEIAAAITRKLQDDTSSRGGSGNSPSMGSGNSARMQRRDSRSSPYAVTDSPRLRRRSSVTGLNSPRLDPPQNIGKIFIPGMDPMRRRADSEEPSEEYHSPVAKNIDNLNKDKVASIPTLSGAAGLRSRSRNKDEEDLINIGGLNISN